MKVLLVIATSLFTTLTFATEPNHYLCHEVGNVDYTVNYNSTSKQGTPHLYIHEGAKSVVPEIIMGEAANAKFETKLIIGYSGGFMPLPAILQSITEIKDLTCTADKVLF